MTKGFVAKAQTVDAFQRAITKLCSEGIATEDIYINVEFEDAIASMEDGSTLIVLSYSDICRGLNEFLTLIVALSERGITLRSIEEPEILITLEKMAEIKNLIALSTKLRVKRTKEGLDHARMNGVRLGRPQGTVTTSHKVHEVIRLHDTRGLSVVKACALVGCHPGTYYRHIAKEHENQKTTIKR